MAGKQFKTMDVWELLALRGEIDAALAAKRKQLEGTRKTGATRAKRSPARQGRSTRAATARSRAGNRKTTRPRKRRARAA